jgi:hypothetical protein
MNNFSIVIRRGPDLNITLAGIMFDKFGKKIQHDIVICDTWLEGFHQVKSKSYSSALFVDSGTVITDWDVFFNLLSTYPHQGLIAHLIWHPTQNLYIDQQCWFMDLDKFEVEDFTAVLVQHPAPVRSTQNLHDNYTPLWVTPSADTVEYTVDGFGQGLIAKQLSYGFPLVNWNYKIRAVKYFMYSTSEVTSWKTHFQQYLDLAETQFWIFNNEPIQILGNKTVITPASGLSWMFNLINMHTKHVQLVDISRTQIKFAKHLWERWDGNDYGSMCVDFIKQNSLQHYELDQPDLSPVERLKLKNTKKLREYINLTFAKLTKFYELENFQKLWTEAKQNKTVEFYNDNLINWATNNELTDVSKIWASNILDYKWTMLNSSHEQCCEFRKLLV